MGISEQQERQMPSVTRFDHDCSLEQRHTAAQKMMAEQLAEKAQLAATKLEVMALESDPALVYGSDVRMMESLKHKKNHILIKSSSSSEEEEKRCSIEKEEAEKRAREAANQAEVIAKRKRKIELMAKEESVLKMIATAIWNLAEKGNLTPPTVSQSGLEHILSKMEPFVESHREHPPHFLKFIRDVVSAMNEYDIEMSCENKFRNLQSLGLRILLCSLVLVDRLVTRLTGSILNTKTVYRLVLSCMLCVSKFSEDEPLNNQFWSKVGCVPLFNLNQCEICLAQELDFNFRVPMEAYESMLHMFALYPTSSSP